jgi:1-acyl-sn-glycerol-3-phosphate acyltransferase
VTYVVRYALIALYTVFWSTLALPLCVFDRRGRAAQYVARRWIAWTLASCRIEVETEGLERARENQPCVVMCNHQSVFDIAALVHTLPGYWKFVAKRELLWIPFFGWALALADQVVVDRRNREKAVRSLKRAADRIRSGTTVIVFPQGTRVTSDALGEFKSGGFHLAIRAGVPVLPVSVSGTRRITPKKSLRVESGRILVRFGEPIPTAHLDIEQRNELKKQVREAIMAGFDPALQGDW